jgi:adenylate cyclase
VNVASRLEGINKEFGTTILVSRAVQERADAAFAFRPLGKARAKGRAEEIEVFELTGLAADAAQAATQPSSDAAMQQAS